MKQPNVHSEQVSMAARKEKMTPRFEVHGLNL